MITVIGDAILDKFLYCSSTRMSPECPNAPVLHINDICYKIGGAGNVALNIAALNQEVSLFSCINRLGYLKHLIEGQNIILSCISNENDDVTKTRIYNGDTCIARIDEDFELKCDIGKLIRKIKNFNSDLLVISDYGKGLLLNYSKDLIAWALANNIRVIVDTKKDFDRYAGVFMLKPNLKEFYEYINEPIPDTEIDIINNTQKLGIILANKLHISNLVITAGKLGCFVINDSKSKYFAANPNVKVVDVTGAGDSFLAALAVGVYEGMNIRDTVTFANNIAQIAITQKGTAIVNREQIR